MRTLYFLLTLSLLSQSHLFAQCSGGLNEVRVIFEFDNNIIDGEWEVYNAYNGDPWAFGNFDSGDQGTVDDNKVCVPDGCYTLFIRENSTDGFRNNYYIVFNGDTLAQGGNFSSTNHIDFCVPDAADTCMASDLFISECLIGPADNRAIELSNFSSSSISLSDYSIAKYESTKGQWEPALQLSGVLLPSDIFILSHANANAQILAKANQSTLDSTMVFDHIDSIGLFKNGQLIDIVKGRYSSVDMVRNHNSPAPSTNFTLGNWAPYTGSNYAQLGRHLYQTCAAYPQVITTDKPLAKTEQYLQLAPNPNRGEFWIANSSPIIAVEIYSIDGKVLQQIHVNNETTNLQVNSQLPSGIYFIKVDLTDKSICKKLQILR